MASIDKVCHKPLTLFQHLQNLYDMVDTSVLNSQIIAM
jgi:hypothetical protein